MERLKEVRGAPLFGLSRWRLHHASLQAMLAPGRRQATVAQPALIIGTNTGNASSLLISPSFSSNLLLITDSSTAPFSAMHQIALETANAVFILAV
jgi:hypothetical protein